MNEYALMLNMFEYTWINRVLNMPEFWLCLIQHIASGHSTDYCTVIETELYSEHHQTFKVEHFAKIRMPEYRCTTSNSQGRGGFVELGHFDKHFIKNTKKDPTG